MKAELATIDMNPPRTHSIVDLFGALPTDRFQDLSEELEQVDIYYIPTRYPDALPGSLPDGLPSKEEAIFAISVARACWQRVDGNQ